MLEYPLFSVALSITTATVSLALGIASLHLDHYAFFMREQQELATSAALMSRLCRDIGTGVLVLGSVLTFGVSLL